MGKILKHDDTVLVTLEEEGLVRKVVLGNKWSGLRKVTPEEVVDREIRALQELIDIKGVQRFVARESENTFYSEYIEADSLLSYRGYLPCGYFDTLNQIMHQCYSRGIYKLVQCRADFLITPKLEPIIIDFGDILFYDDQIAQIHGITYLAKLYSYIRIRDLRERYTSSGLSEGAN